jgi:Flp pilus assembly protein TadG
MSSTLGKRLTGFCNARGGNTAMIFALSAPVLMFGIAFAIDFTNATVVKSKLNAAADAAALAALTPAMMQQTDAVAQAAAVQMFDARAAGLGSLVTGQTAVTVTITHPTGNAGIRIVNVAYSVQNNTIFSGTLHTNSMGINGTSVAQASVPPNINFYLLLDNSPSMSLPATSDGITQMQKITSTQEGGVGCAFACHQASTNNSDTAGNLCSTGGSNPVYSSPTQSGGYCASTVTINGKSQSVTQIDNYAMARYNNIQLRLDELTTGITTLMNTAYGNATSGIYSTPPVYQFAAYSMDSLWSIGNPSNTLLMAMTPNYQSSWTSASTNFGVMEMFSNNNNCANSSCSSSTGPGDVATNYDNALSDINSTIPAPGNGTNVAGDKPQGVLFFVTDGVEDEQNLVRLIQPVNGNNGTNYCSQIKARGIKIAILYTEYLPVPSNSFYQGNVAPFQANIGSYLQACASPNLYYDAAIGADLGAALAQLFQTVVQNASLSN